MGVRLELFLPWGHLVWCLWCGFSRAVLILVLVFLQLSHILAWKEVGRLWVSSSNERVCSACSMCSFALGAGSENLCSRLVPYSLCNKSFHTHPVRSFTKQGTWGQGLSGVERANQMSGNWSGQKETSRGEVIFRPWTRHTVGPDGGDWQANASGKAPTVLGNDGKSGGAGVSRSPLLAS